jgi:hypothetical protein
LASEYLEWGTQESEWCSSSLKIRGWRPRVADGANKDQSSLLENSLWLGKAALYSLFRPVFDWVTPITFIEDLLLSQNAPILSVNVFQPSELAYKINHHRGEDMLNSFLFWSFKKLSKAS